MSWVFNTRCASVQCVMNWICDAFRTWKTEALAVRVLFLELLWDCKQECKSQLSKERQTYVPEHIYFTYRSWQLWPAHLGPEKGRAGDGVGRDEGPPWRQEHIYGLEEPDGRERQRVLVRTITLKQLSELSVTPLTAPGVNWRTCFCFTSVS